MRVVTADVNDADAAVIPEKSCSLVVEIAVRICYPSHMKWRITFNAPVTLCFVALCFIATLLGYLTDNISTKLLFATYATSLLDPLFYVRLFTHVLGHSGWDHFASNMIYILLLGPLLEEKYGSKPLIGVILITAFSSGIINAIFMPGIALLGASGVCFAFIIMGSVTNIREGEIPLTFILVFIVFIGQQAFIGLTVDDNISNLSHIIGGIVGGACGFALTRALQKRQSPGQPGQ